MVKLKAAIGGEGLPWEILHVASLIQEVGYLMARRKDQC